MVENLRTYREPAAWLLLAGCVAWTIWRLAAGLSALGPVGVLGHYSTSVFSILAALIVLLAAGLMVLVDPVPRRAGLFCTLAASYATLALLTALVFQLCAIIQPVEPESWLIRVIGLIGFVVLHLIPGAVVIALWWTRGRVVADRTHEVREIIPGDFGLRREHLIDGADEPTRRISREDLIDAPDEPTRRIPRENLGHDLTSQ